MAEIKPKKPELKSKTISLKKKGEKSVIPVKNLHAVLSWTAPVDLDFYAYFKLKTTAPKEEKGWLKKLITGPGCQPGAEGVVYFAERGSKSAYPWIYLDQDAGIGDKGGKNEENLYFIDLTYMEHILIVANIFNKPDANFATYDGTVTIKTDGKNFEVPLTATTGGNYCIIAHIDNTAGDCPVLINVNKVNEYEPSINSFLSSEK